MSVFDYFTLHRQETQFLKKQPLLQDHLTTYNNTCRDLTVSQESLLLLFLPVRDPTIDFKAAPMLLPGVCKFELFLSRP